MLSSHMACTTLVASSQDFGFRSSELNPLVSPVFLLALQSLSFLFHDWEKEQLLPKELWCDEDESVFASAFRKVHNTNGFTKVVLAPSLWRGIVLSLSPREDQIHIPCIMKFDFHYSLSYENEEKMKNLLKWERLNKIVSIMINANIGKNLYLLAIYALMETPAKDLISELGLLLFLLIFFLKQRLKQLKLASNQLYSWGWLRTSYPPASFSEDRYYTCVPPNWLMWCCRLCGLHAC